jgi:hypothetical protein
MPIPMPSNPKFPTITGVRWFNLAILTITPAISVYGLVFAPRLRGTVIFAILYYVFSMLGKTDPVLTAGWTDSAVAV